MSAKPRKTKPHRIYLQVRDIEILARLFESRVMRSCHISALFFSGRPEATKKRLQALCHAKLIERRPGKVNEPSIYSITSTGMKALDEAGYENIAFEMTSFGANRRIRVSDLTLQHELQVMDVKVALTIALNNCAAYKLLEFSNRPSLFQFEGFISSADGYGGRPTVLKPDGFLTIEENSANGASSQQHFFLELDRSTESQRILTTKAFLYREYYRSGKFAVRYGAEPSAYRQYPFRVLMVLATAERLNRTAQSLLKMREPMCTQIWLSTFKDLLGNPLGAIWIRPKDIHDADNPADKSSSYSVPKVIADPAIIGHRLLERGLSLSHPELRTNKECYESQ